MTTQASPTAGSATTAEAPRPTLGPNDRTIDAAFARRVLPRRVAGAHKWGVGGLVIVAGSPSYVGAAALCAQAAGRAGAGIVVLAVPRGIVGAIAPAVLEAAYVPLPETESVAGARRAVEEIAGKLEKATALVVGPGLGDDESTAGLLGALFGTARGNATAIGFAGSSGSAGSSRSSSLGFSTGREAAPTRSATAAEDTPAGPVVQGKTIVVDADGLNWLAKQEAWTTLLTPGMAVLTPHPGELSRLTGRDTEEITADPVAAARAAARDAGQVVVLKYGYTVVTDGERTLVADDAPTSLASAGTGDVLAGTIGALLAQGLAPLDAAGLAVLLGTRAARRLEARTGTLGLVAGDLPLAIAAEIAALEAEGADGA